MSFLAPAAISGGIGLLGSLFGGGGGDAGDASQAAMEQERQFMQQAMGMLSPYNKGGIGAMGQLQGMYSQDPQDIINKILGGYQASSGEKYQAGQAQDALQNQLNAAGIGGSGAAIQQSGNLAQNLAQQGQQQYLQNVLGQRQQEQQGLQGLYSGGLSAAQTGAGLLGQEGQAMGGLAGAGILGQGQEKSNMFSGLGSLAGLFGGSGGLGNLFGGSGGLGNLFGGGAKPFIDPDTGIQAAPGGFAPQFGF